MLIIPALNGGQNLGVFVQALANRKDGKTAFGQNRTPIAKIQDFQQKVRVDTKSVT